MVAMARGSVRARASTNDEDAKQSSRARAADNLWGMQVFAWCLVGCFSEINVTIKRG